MNNAFSIKDCALIAIATGKRAQNLPELQTILSSIEPDSVYYHFWGSLLKARFENPECHNDFAAWAGHDLHDKVLAERLCIVDPTAFDSMEALRLELIDIVEERLDELEYPPISKREARFEFIRSQIVIFDTLLEAKTPAEFVEILPLMSIGSIFYHFIDARRRNERHLDDFQNWMKDLPADYSEICHGIAEIDPYFSTLPELRHRLVTIFKNYF